MRYKNAKTDQSDAHENCDAGGSADHFQCSQREQAQR